MFLRNPQIQIWAIIIDTTARSYTSDCFFTTKSTKWNLAIYSKHFRIAFTPIVITGHFAQGLILIK